MYVPIFKVHEPSNNIIIIHSWSIAYTRHAQSRAPFVYNYVIYNTKSMSTRWRTRLNPRRICKLFVNTTVFTNTPSIRITERQSNEHSTFLSKSYLSR